MAHVCQGTGCDLTAAQCVVHGAQRWAETCLHLGAQSRELESRLRPSCSLVQGQRGQVWLVEGAGGVEQSPVCPLTRLRGGHRRAVPLRGCLGPGAAGRAGWIRPLPPEQERGFNRTPVQSAGALPALVCSH